MTIQHTNNDSHMLCSYIRPCLEFALLFVQETGGMSGFPPWTKAMQLGGGHLEEEGVTPGQGHPISLFVHSPNVMEVFNSCCSMISLFATLCCLLIVSRKHCFIRLCAACLALSLWLYTHLPVKSWLIYLTYLIGCICLESSLLLPTENCSAQQCRALDPEWRQENWQTIFQLSVTQSIIDQCKVWQI